LLVVYIDITGGVFIPLFVLHSFILLTGLSDVFFGICCISLFLSFFLSFFLSRLVPFVFLRGTRFFRFSNHACIGRSLRRVFSVSFVGRNVEWEEDEARGPRSVDEIWWWLL
jgi:hypothetical protein